MADYGHYFLGSIIVSDKDGQKFIIDGQQRLTTLTLLLIYLQHQLEDDRAEGPARRADLLAEIRQAVVQPRHPRAHAPAWRRSTPASEFDDDDASGVGREHPRALRRHRGALPEEIAGDALPYFVDWLIENVHLVEITAYSDGDAYTIFETMNDRGLSLTPADMLKGYLLANITDADERRTRASSVWKERVAALAELGKDEDADGIKSWLRSQYAETHPRAQARRCSRRTSICIGTEFHRWVRDHEERLGLDNERRLRALHRARLRLLQPLVRAPAARQPRR